MVSNVVLADAYASIYHEAERLAGGLDDLAQRATVYHHLFEHSGRNHAFPLIAAHGALWARSYFQFGMKLGRLCVWQYFDSSEKRRHQLQLLDEFADAFRDINRRVCIETYTTYHFAEQCGEASGASEFVPPKLLDQLNRCHAARRSGRELSTEAKRELFRVFFLNEQETLVGPSIERAVESFRWPLMRFLALRPLIRFAFFERRPLLFRNFADTQLRIEQGMAAFDEAARVGWLAVEQSLGRYQVLPSAFFSNSQTHYARMREHVLAAA